MIALLPLSGFLLLSACATFPQPHGEFARIDTNQASTGQWTGSDVRWGGIVTGLRSTDAGTCLEIAYFPTDRFDGMPYFYFPGPTGSAPLFEQSRRMIQYSTDLVNAQRGIPPRFLACGGEFMSKDSSERGAVVTVAGIIRPPQIYQLDKSQCEQKWTSTYLGNVHASNESDCVVSIPELTITGIKAWRDPPSYNPNFPGKDSNAGS